MLRKLPDADKQIMPCVSESHRPPNNMVLNAGKWEWTCPACGEKTVFEIPAWYCGYEGNAYVVKQKD